VLDEDHSGRNENAERPGGKARILRIEEYGDLWKDRIQEGRVKAKIRLAGKWLARAGFAPGGHVTVACIAPGVMELRAGRVL
jgi:hypothetical protein